MTYYQELRTAADTARDAHSDLERKVKDALSLCERYETPEQNAVARSLAWKIRGILEPTK